MRRQGPGLREPLLEGRLRAQSTLPKALGAAVSDKRLSSKTNLASLLTKPVPPTLEQPAKVLPVQHVKEAISPKTPNPFAKAGFFSRWFFLWTNTIFEIATSKTLRNADLYTIGKLIQSRELDGLFEQTQRAHPQLDEYSVCRKVVRPMLTKGTIMYICSNLVEFAIPLAVRQLSGLLGSSVVIYSVDVTDYIEYLYMLLIFVILLVRYLLWNQSMFFLKASGARLQILLRGRILKKLMKIRLPELEEYQELSIVSLVTLDTDNIGSGLMIFPDFLNAFCLFTLGFYYLNFHQSTVAMMVILLLLVLGLYRLVHSRVAFYKKNLLEVSDERCKLIRMLIRDISLIKIYQMDPLFYEKIVEAHLIQNDITKRYLIWEQVASVVTFYLPTLFGLIIFGYSVLETGNQTISEETSYLVLTVLSIIKVPLGSIADGFRKWPNYRASRSRITTFLNKIECSGKNSEEFIAQVLIEPSNTEEVNIGTIEFKNCYLVFNMARNKDFRNERDSILLLDTLESVSGKEYADIKDLTLKIESGQKVCIPGNRESEANMFLLAICKELECCDGEFVAKGKILYQNSQMHFFEDSVYQNIVLGLPLNKARYRFALEVSGLSGLLKGPDNIETNIILGNGKDLPPDLKKMIILARLIYQEADIVLIDGFFDLFPLKFRKNIVPQLLSKHWIHTTVIVATAVQQIGSLCERYIEISQGRLQKDMRPKDFSELEIGMFDLTMESEEASDLQTQKNEVELLPMALIRESFKDVTRLRSESQSLLIESQDYRKKLRLLRQQSQKQAVYFVSNLSEKKRGKQQRILYRFFLFNSGYFLPLFMLLLVIVAFSSTYLFSWYVASWRIDKMGWDSQEYFEIFISIGAITLITIIALSIVFVYSVRKFSVKLFIYAIKGLISHSLEWFHETSGSRILSKFVTEFNQLDESLGIIVNVYFQQFIRFHLVFFIIMYETYFTGAIIIIIYFLIRRTQSKFRPALRSIREVITSNQSYLIHSTLDLYRGLVNFRNSQAQSYANENCLTINEIYQNSKIHQNNISDRWLCARIHGYLIFLPLCVIANGIIRKALRLEADPNESIKLTISLDLIFTANSFVASFLSKTALTTALEGVKDLIEPDTQAEKRKILTESIKAKSAAHGMRVDVAGVVVTNTFTGIPLTAGVSMGLLPGSRTALVGSKGSGKQTLLALLARVIDPSQIITGCVYLDGKNLQDIPEDDLRQQVFLISEHFRLYSGSLRKNLDPLQRFSDEELVLALEYVNYWKLLDWESGSIGGFGTRFSSKTQIRGNSVPKQSKQKQPRMTTIRETLRISVDVNTEAPSFHAVHQALKGMSDVRHKELTEHQDFKASVHTLETPLDLDKAGVDKADLDGLSSVADEPLHTQTGASGLPGVLPPTDPLTAQPVQPPADPKHKLKHSDESLQDLGLQVEGCSVDGLEMVGAGLCFDEDQDAGIDTEAFGTGFFGDSTNRMSQNQRGTL